MSLQSATIHQAQQSIYSFLAKVFSSHPTMDSVVGLRQMAETLGIPYSTEASLDELDREYMRLFVVPGPYYVAPYESVFRDRWLVPSFLKPGSNPGESNVTIKGLVMGESTLAVRQCYLEAGVLPTKDLPDHIANELSFIAYLWACESEETSPEAETLADRRAKFRDEHLQKWISQLRERVIENESLGYYGAAIQVVEAVLQNDL